MKSAVATKKKKTKLGREKKKLLFYSLWIILPLAHIAIFYFAVNFNSILMAFQKYEVIDGRGSYVWAGLQNFKTLFENFAATSMYGTMVKNSVLGFLIPELVTFIPSIITSYYVYKKLKFGKFFRKLLYLPSLLSVLALSVIQFYMLELGVPELASHFGHEIQGLLGNPNTAFGALVVLQIWFGFCKGIMLYPATMSSIPDSALESARIDGCGLWGEFIHIILPLIYPTITVVLITDLAGVCRIDLNIFNMFGQYADMKFGTIGYFIYKETLTAGMSDYPYLASYGVFLTIILVPLVLVIRHLMVRFGPKSD